MTSERRRCDRGLKLATEIRRGEIRLGGGIESVLASAGQVSESIDYSSNRVALSGALGLSTGLNLVTKSFSAGTRSRIRSESTMTKASNRNLASVEVSHS